MASTQAQFIFYNHFNIFLMPLHLDTITQYNLNSDSKQNPNTYLLV